MNPRLTKLLVVASIAAAVAGCASTEPNASLEEARAAVRSAEQDPVVASAAPIELERARTTFNRAQSLYDDSGNKERVRLEHNAYLATRYAEIAVANADTARAREAVENAEAERNRVLLEARTADAERAQQAAQSAQREAGRRAAETADALERNRELGDALAELQAEETERGLVLTLGDVLFDTNEATLAVGADRTIDQLAAFLSEYEERVVLIEGHTDSRGTDEYNQMLSERRANSVRDALLASGIAINRVQTRGLGETAPVATNDTDAGRQQNRRVEILISDRDGNIHAFN